MNKFLSRKLAVALSYGLLVALNTKLSLNVPENVLLGLAGLAGLYIWKQGQIDSKKSE